MSQRQEFFLYYTKVASTHIEETKKTRVKHKKVCAKDIYFLIYLVFCNRKKTICLKIYFCLELCITLRRLIHLMTQTFCLGLKCYHRLNKITQNKSYKKHKVISKSIYSLNHLYFIQYARKIFNDSLHYVTI